jgi:hypothetical protein
VDTSACLKAVTTQNAYPYRESNPGHPALSLVTILTELSKFSQESAFTRASTKVTRTGSRGTGVDPDPAYWYIGRCIQKFPDWPPGPRTANGTALCH